MSPDTRSSIFFTQVLGRVQLKIRGHQTLQKKIGHRQSNQKIARRCIFSYRSIARVQLKIRGRQTLQKKIGHRQSNQKIAMRCIFFYRSIARVQLYSACDDLRLLFLNF